MTKRLLIATLGAVAAVSLFGGSSVRAARPEAARDVQVFLDELERTHPNPYHATPRTEFRAAADRLVARLPELDDDQLLVELMRLVALLGERDGHAHLHPLDTQHARTLHVYPLATYGFTDGVYVTAAPGHADLVGKRLVAIDGRALADVLALVDALVPTDNDVTRRAHRSPYLLCAEVLHGLGVTPEASRARFTVEDGAGARTDVDLAPLAAAAYTPALRPWYPRFVDGLPKRSRPLFVSRRGTDQWLTTLDRGRVAYLSYNLTFAPTYATAQRLLRLARKPKIRRVVVDLRNNPGGDIGTYPPLLDVLRSRTVNRPNRLYVLIGPTTFSAAVHFALDLDRRTRAVFVGERAGGSPNHYSDTIDLRLPVTGYVVGVPHVYFEKRPGTSGLAFDPDVVVDLTGADFFAGRDPVLARALALR